jgi:shikimate kinase
MGNIVLTGFMGSGKTVVARQLARILGMKVIDVDTEIEKSTKMTINEIFKQFGEPRFREIETGTIKQVSENNNVIISTGGGAVLKQENMDAMREKGVIVCLTVAPETILERTMKTKDRPLLLVENPLERIKELLEYRKPFYEKADIMIDTESKTPLQIAEEIVGRIKGYN